MSRMVPRNTWNQSVGVLDRDFEIFSQVFESKNMSRAAERLGSEQGTVSKVIARLERRLGTKLFLRYRQGVLPTESAQALHRAVEDIEATWKKAKRGAYHGVEPLTVRIGAHRSLAVSYLGQITQRLAERLPGLYPEILFTNSFEAIQRVQKRELDLALVASAPKSPDLVVRKFAQEDIEICGLDPGAKDVTLLCNSQMVMFQKIQARIRFRKIVDISDYEVIASMAEVDRSSWAILPTGVRKRFSRLKKINVVQEDVPIFLAAYPRSAAAKVLAGLKVE